MPPHSSHSRRGPGSRQRRHRRRPPTGWLGLMALAVLGVLGLAFFTIQNSGQSPDATVDIDDSARKPQLVAGVAVEAPWVDHGRVPLDTPVGHEWLLRNTGPVTVSLGEASIETLEGC